MDLKRIGLFLSEQRRKKNMTQKELAIILSVSNQAISKWERGLCYPDITLLPLLCETLGISIVEFLNGEENEIHLINDEDIKKAVDRTLEYSKELINKDRIKQKKILQSFIISMCLIFVILFWVIDFNRYLSFEKPLFTIYSSEKFFGNNTITEFYGIGYKVTKYQSQYGKNIFEFGWIFSQYENISINEKILDSINNSLQQYNVSKNDTICFAKSKILSTELNEQDLNVYLWFLQKCYIEIDNKLIEDTGISGPYKVVLTLINHSYEIKNYDYPKDSSYMNDINEIFPTNVQSLISSFYDTQYSRDLIDLIEDEITKVNSLSN